MGANTDWLASLSPWPADGFGLERMQALLERLGHPERTFDSIHVVGTKGKSTATRTIAALLAAEGLRTGAYTSPHVAGWWERLDTDQDGLLTPGISAVPLQATGDPPYAVLAAEIALLHARLDDLQGRLEG